MSYLRTLLLKMLLGLKPTTLQSLGKCANHCPIADLQEADAQVTFEDQQKINKFARSNAKLQDIKEELKARKKELENLEFAEEELMMLDSDDAPIPYQVGEVFISVDSDETNAMLEKAKQSTREQMESLEKQAAEYKKTLQDLKVQLYAKFGTNINLEEEEDS